MDSKDLDLLVKRYLAGECTPEEEKFVLEWYENMPSLEGEHMPQLETAIWAKLQEKAMVGSALRQYRITHFATPLKIAASVMLVAALAITGYFISKENNENSSSRFIVSVNKTNNIELVSLEDGSKISLQPNSSIKYPQHFSAVNREVFLSGEAFFEIAHDKNHPFIVYARDVTTKVLGTSFNIKAYDYGKAVSILVRTGKVSVTTTKTKTYTIPLEQETLLTPNQQLVFDITSQESSVSLAEKPVVVEAVPLLNMKFQKVPVTEIFEALEKAYKVDIQFDAEKMKTCRLTTDLTADEDLYDRLRFICHAIGVKYTINDMKIIIEGQGCK